MASQSKGFLREKNTWCKIPASQCSTTHPPIELPLQRGFKPQTICTNHMENLMAWQCNVALQARPCRPSFFVALRYDKVKFLWALWKTSIECEYLRNPSLWFCARSPTFRLKPSAKLWLFDPAGNHQHLSDRLHFRPIRGNRDENENGLHRCNQNSGSILPGFTTSRDSRKTNDTQRSHTANSTNPPTDGICSAVRVPLADEIIDHQEPWTPGNAKIALQERLCKQ